MKKAIGSVLFVFVFLTAFLNGCAPASTPVPPTSTVLPPGPRTFTSSRFGYTITVPDGWTKYEQPGQWDGNTVAEQGDDGMDLFSLPTARVPPLEIGFLPVAAGTSLENWAKTEAQHTIPPVCKEDSTMDPLTVGGKAALIQHLPCPDVGETFQVINVYLVLGDQGVLVQWGGDASSESTFKGILEAMDLP